MTRECGSCTLCCKLLGVKELNKPAFKWCPHVLKGKGCGIYGDRPHTCRGFECMWLMGTWPEDMKPDRIKIVPSVTPDVKSKDVVLYIDPGYPAAHLEPKMSGMIDKMVSRGLNVIIVKQGIATKG